MGKLEKFEKEVELENPGGGIESLMAGEVKFGEIYEDVTAKIGKMEENQRRALILLVACDRIFGFFEDRGGQSNKLLVELMRKLAGELELTPPEPPLKLRGGGESYVEAMAREAGGYYDELVERGVSEIVNELGAKNVFCTVWEMISEVVTTKNPAEAGLID